MLHILDVSSSHPFNLPHTSKTLPPLTTDTTDNPQRIVSSRTTSTTLPPRSVPALARYLRIFYTLSLSSPTANTTEENKTDVIVSRVVELATTAPEEYPAEELEWMASTTFNRAIDAYCTADEVGCRRLAQQAVGIAGCLERVDGGTLRDDLMRRADLLVWEG